MLRALAAAALLLAVNVTVPGTAAFQPTESVLHIRVVVAGAGQTAMPVPRHALLISDNPPTTTPRRVVTGTDGTANVRLRPGNYTVESDAPFTFDGKAYEWRQIVDIATGRDLNLELTTANADITPVTAATLSNMPVEVSVSSLLTEWQDSVVALWTPTSHASGFVIERRRAHRHEPTRDRCVDVGRSADHGCDQSRRERSGVESRERRDGTPDQFGAVGVDAPGTARVRGGRDGHDCQGSGNRDDRIAAARDEGARVRRSEPDRPAHAGDRSGHSGRQFGRARIHVSRRLRRADFFRRR